MFYTEICPSKEKILSVLPVAYLQNLIKTDFFLHSNYYKSDTYKVLIGFKMYI